MGISGLLPVLRSATKRVHLSDFSGQSVAVDAYSWLHRGIYGSCAVDLFHGRDNESYIDFCMEKVYQLKNFNVNPIIVFDGGPLPMKKSRELMREKNRTSNRQEALRLLAVGDAGKAYNFIQRAAEVTPRMAARLIGELQRARISYIVAPYEADAQMAWLGHSGRVAAVVTEDSDLLLFGCRRVLFKLDTQSGWADEVCPSRFLANGSVKDCELHTIFTKTESSKDLDFSMFTADSFRHCCILSGCDYLDSLPGIGLKTAYKMMRRDPSNIDRILNTLRAELGPKMPSNYIDSFVKADLTFLHQRVFDDRLGRLVLLRPLEGTAGMETGSLDFLGPLFEDSTAVKVSQGLYCPVLYSPFDLQVFSARHKKSNYVGKKRSVEVVEDNKENVLVKANGRDGLFNRFSNNTDSIESAVNAGQSVNYSLNSNSFFQGKSRQMSIIDSFFKPRSSNEKIKSNIEQVLTARTLENNDGIESEAQKIRPPKEQMGKLYSL